MFIRPSSRSITGNTSSIGTRLHKASIASTRLSRYPGRSNPKYVKRASSSSPPSPDDQPSTSSPVIPSTHPSPSLPDEGVSGIEKPRRGRVIVKVKPPSADTPADSPSIQNADASSGGNGGDGNDLPPSQLSAAILWSPEPQSRTSEPQNLDLPPPEIFEDVLDKFHITLHPQTQHRATYSQDGSTNPIVEPTLALYCPIEGGDYVVDETVKELARRAEADVVVLDCVQLAAGSVGRFGSGASSLVNEYFLVLVRRGADYMRLTQPQVRFNCPTTLFIFRFPPRPRHRLPRGLLDCPRRKKTVSFTRTNSPLPI